jgi:hypothetical protein
MDPFPSCAGYETDAAQVHERLYAADVYTHQPFFLSKKSLMTEKFCFMA